jgi:hypothetical protein
VSQVPSSDVDILQGWKGVGDRKEELGQCPEKDMCACLASRSGQELLMWRRLSTFFRSGFQDQISYRSSSCC